MIGGSGATVELTIAGNVRKSYPAPTPAQAQLLHAQAVFMQRHRHPFAQVVRAGPGWYDMPQLYPWPARMPISRRLRMLKQTLRELWQRDLTDLDGMALPDARGPATDAHLAYVLPLVPADRPRAAAFLKDEWTALRRMRLTWACTHGDATLENALLAEDGTVRLIDPLPYSSRMPPLRAVDLGKMLQSADGYEGRKYEHGWPEPDILTYTEVLDAESMADSRAAFYFRIVAYVRMLRYVKGPNYDFAMEVLKC